MPTEYGVLCIDSIEAKATYTRIWSMEEKTLGTPYIPSRCEQGKGQYGVRIPYFREMRHWQDAM